MTKDQSAAIEREKIARIIDPEAFEALVAKRGYKTDVDYWEDWLRKIGWRRDVALAKADAILLALADSRPVGEPEVDGWLPNILCPTDGIWRAHRLPDGTEIVAMFDGYSQGPHAGRWRQRAFVCHNPSRPTGRSIGGVGQFTEPYDTFIVSDLPPTVYPTHFRPNDTVFGPALLAARPPVEEGGE